MGINVKRSSVIFGVIDIDFLCPRFIIGAVSAVAVRHLHGICKNVIHTLFAV